MVLIRSSSPRGFRWTLDRIELFLVPLPCRSLGRCPVAPAFVDSSRTRQYCAFTHRGDGEVRTKAFLAIAVMVAAAAAWRECGGVAARDCRRVAG